MFNLLLGKNKGFTLIELLVVIAIIGLLAAVVTVSTGPARIKARDAVRKSDLQSVASALEMYYAQNRQFPQKNTWSWDNDLANQLLPHLTAWPQDPQQGAGYDDGYVYYGESGRFVLDATLESSTETITLTDIVSPEVVPPADATNFFRSGAYQYGEKIHFRISR